MNAVKSDCFDGSKHFIAHFAELQKRSDEQELEINKLKNELIQANAKIADLEIASETDALTGLRNRRFFDLQLKHEVAHSWRSKEAVAVAVFDIDNFKPINSKYLHVGGDAILKQCAVILQESCREQDWVARVGGEEFAFILPGTAASNACILLERIRSKIAAHRFSVPGTDETISVTFSIGLTELLADEAEKAEDVYGKATLALNQAKNTGKNKIVVA